MVFQRIEATEQDCPFPGNAKHELRGMVAQLSRDTVTFLTGQHPPPTTLPSDHPREGIITVQHDFCFSAKDYVSATDDWNAVVSELRENRHGVVSAANIRLSEHWHGLCRKHLSLLFHFRIRKGWIEAVQYHSNVADQMNLHVRRR